MLRSSTLSIDLDAIHHNMLQFIHTQKQIMVMVKANGYGTDAVILSKYIQKHLRAHVPFLGVSHVSEGVHLREAGIEMPIFVISSPPFLADAIVEYNLTAAISSIEEVNALNQAAQKHQQRVSIHLYLNTGMNRFGTQTELLDKLTQTIQHSSNLYLDGVMTHFIGADNPELDSLTHKQISIFQNFVTSLPQPPRWIHAANSAGATRFSLPFCNLARIGLGILGYGTCPPSVQPTLTLTTTLNSINPCKKGEGVGYNHAYRMPHENGRIGLIPFGYYDGYSRSMEGKGYAIIREKKAPMIGIFCMDFIMLDITHIPEAQVGERVVLFDASLSPEIAADLEKTNVREILVRLSSRIKRNWLFTPKPKLENESTNSKRISNAL
ncbi:MAG: Alanine racemase 1 [Chlamydiales bacterium]|nr:Alanine racemase 1 [Chlamydiales bacterium]